MSGKPTTASADGVTGGYEASRFNALRHGVLSRWTVLPWEDEGEYCTLLRSLVDEHLPTGPTEEHLVEELAGIMWRKRRLRIAEAAASRRGLMERLPTYRETVKAALVPLGADEQIEHVIDTIRATAEHTAEDLRDLEEDASMTARALARLRDDGPEAYQSALAELRWDTQQWWAQTVRAPDDEDEPYTGDGAGLQRFLEAKVETWYATRRRELENRPLIRAQAYGEACDLDDLERLARYESHLDRKLERTLAMLLRLKELRQSVCPN
jgi:hypothetical protein